MIINDVSHDKVNFWMAWSIANAIGLGLAWALGELIGRQIAELLGWKTGQLFGVVLFEGFMWLSRGIVLFRMKSYEILKPLEISIWVITELFGWIITRGATQEESLIAFTGGGIFATALGAMMWIIFWFMKIPKPRRKFWALRALLWTFVGFFGGALLLTLFLVIALEFSNTLAKMYSPFLGMAIAGLILGGLLGSTTGLALIRFMHWQTAET